jgi:hypothetical protein
MSIGLSNMTLSQCACAGGQIARQLTNSFDTPVLVVACRSDTDIIQCVNFTCPCSRRNLRQTTTSVWCQTVYQTTQQPPQTSQITAALAPIARVTEVSAIALPLTQQLVWSEQLLASYDVAPAFPLFVVLGCGAFVLIAVAVALVMVLRRPRQIIIMGGQPEGPVRPGSVLRIKIM